jgi:hypothetical protein
VTQPFVHLGKGESNLANALEFPHARHIVRSGTPHDAWAPTRWPAHNDGYRNAGSGP